MREILEYKYFIVVLTQKIFKQEQKSVTSKIFHQKFFSGCLVIFLLYEKNVKSLWAWIGRYKQNNFIGSVKCFLDIQEQNTCFYGCSNLSLYIFIRKIIPVALRFLLLFHFTYNGIPLLSFWLNRYPCRQASWNLL